MLAAEAEEITVVSRGEVTRISKKERMEQFAAYLAGTEVTEYRDLSPPVVRVSGDGTMGWLIARVRIAGIRSTDEGGREPFESTWAWIELYEKCGNAWVRTGEVSNMEPPDADSAD